MRESLLKVVHHTHLPFRVQVQFYLVNHHDCGLVKGAIALRACHSHLAGNIAYERYVRFFTIRQLAETEGFALLLDNKRERIPLHAEAAIARQEVLDCGTNGFKLVITEELLAQFTVEFVFQVLAFAEPQEERMKVYAVVQATVEGVQGAKFMLLAHTQGHRIHHPVHGIKIHQGQVVHLVVRKKFHLGIGIVVQFGTVRLPVYRFSVR